LPRLSEKNVTCQMYKPKQESASIPDTKDGEERRKGSKRSGVSVMISLPSLICLLLYLFASVKREETGFAYSLGYGK
jgi:hypothetical protein